MLRFSTLALVLACGCGAALRDSASSPLRIELSAPARVNDNAIKVTATYLNRSHEDLTLFRAGRTEEPETTPLLHTARDAKTLEMEPFVQPPHYYTEDLVLSPGDTWEEAWSIDTSGESSMHVRVVWLVIGIPEAESNTVCWHRRCMPPTNGQNGRGR